MKNGCLFGNFTAEANDCGEPIRLRVVEAFAEVQAAIAYCLRAAVKAGEIAPSTDCDEVAAFIVASLQGAQPARQGAAQPAAGGALQGSAVRQRPQAHRPGRTARYVCPARGADLFLPSVDLSNTVVHTESHRDP